MQLESQSKARLGIGFSEETDISKDPDTYIVTSVSFGDRPSGNIATMALRKTTKLKEKEYTQAASMVLSSIRL